MMFKGHGGPWLTGRHDAFAGGDNVALRRAGSDHDVIGLGALQAVHGELGARHVSLQHQGVVAQTRHCHLKVDEELGVGVAPAQFYAPGRDIGNV